MELYWHSLRRNYTASVCSCAFLFSVVVFAVLLLVPFFLAYESHSLWLKENTYREQPVVDYKYKLVAILEGKKTDPTTGEEQDLELFFSTVTSVNNLFPNSVRVPVVRSSPTDWNGDGVMDEQDITLVFPLRCGEEVQQASVAVFFDYTLKSRARVNMESVAFAAHSSFAPATALRLWGELQLRQRGPFTPTGGEKKLYTSTSETLLEPGQVHDSSAALFRTLVERHHVRNVSTHYQHMSTWERVSGRFTAAAATSSAVAATAAAAAAGTAAAATPECPSRPDGGGAGSFSVFMDVRVPTESISYKPEWTEVVKMAWIQYLSLFVVLWVLLDRLQAFVFSNQIVETTMRSEAGVGSTYFYTGPKMHTF